MARICVFCSSSREAAPEFMEAATAVGRLIAAGGHSLVYGGASIGLMGKVADAALAEGGEVVGIMPSWLARDEVAHHGLTEFLPVDNMFERKEKMLELSDAFATLPGGLGTLDELFEVMTLSYLGRLSQPMALLNTSGFFAPLLALFSHGVAAKMIHPSVPGTVQVTESPEELLRALVQRP